MDDDFKNFVGVMLIVIAFNTCDGCGCSCGNSDTEKKIEVINTKVDKLDKRLDKLSCPP